jgi:RecB family exonuclease
MSGVPATRPAPIGAVSPTLANGLLACPLRVAFARDPAIASGSKRPKPDAILGSASHALAEAVSRGEFDATPEESVAETLEARWDAIVSQDHVRLVERTLLGPVPAPNRWPFFESKRASAVRLASEMLLNRRRQPGPARAGSVEVEIDLSCDDPPLTGRIDRIERTGHGITIIDLKSSLPNPARTLPRAYEIQLLLYAALYRGARNELPDKVGIQYFDGTRVTQQVDWTEVDRLIDLVLALREQVNGLSSQRSVADVEMLARPDPENCLYCDYQGLCLPFLRDAAPDMPPYASSVLGRVCDRVKAGSTVRLSIRPGVHEIEPPEPDVIVTGFPESLAPNVDEVVSICWAFRGGRGTDLRVNWLTTIHRWTSPAEQSVEMSGPT